MVYKVGKVIQVWVGMGWVVGGVVVKAAGAWGVVYKVGKCQAEPGFGPTPHFSDGGGVRGSTQRCISQGGDPAGLELGAGWVEVALARRQAMGRPCLDDTA